MTEEVATVFNTLTGLAGYPGLKKLMVAPFDLGVRVIELIEREIEHARAGTAARIIVKINSMVDEDVIVKLYEASCAGVKIDLIVRGICCLRPKLPGVSENIRVISIVGRFLEHSRIYYFENRGDPDVYLSSADWMPRNFYRRVEVAFPLEDPAIRQEMIQDTLPHFLGDRGKARELQADGTYRRLSAPDNAPKSQAQLYFRDRARNLAKLVVETQRAAAPKLTVLQSPPHSS
jgi:polyphosphate kinase